MAASGPQIVEPPRGDSLLTDRRHVVTAALIPPIPPLSDRPIGRTPRKRGFVFLGGRKVVELRNGSRPMGPTRKNYGACRTIRGADAPAVAALLGYHAIHSMVLLF